MSHPAISPARSAGEVSNQTQPLRHPIEAELENVTQPQMEAEYQRLRSLRNLRDTFERTSGQASPSFVYTVRPGDTMSEIARGHRVSLRALLHSNPQIENPDLIYPGDRISIPTVIQPSPNPGATQPALARGARGPVVRDLQLRLRDLGYGPGPLDGIYGPYTESAVRRFQTQNDLAATGRATPETLARLQSTGAERPSVVAPRLAVFPPGSPAQIALFEEAARLIGVPDAWASDPGLRNILVRESGGQVGIPNYTYGERSRDPTRWAEVHAELRQGAITARSSATGLGQLLLRNVDRYYPQGRDGIGDPLQEAAGMLAYIRDRYGHPSIAWARYNTLHEGY